MSKKYREERKAKKDAIRAMQREKEWKDPGIDDIIAKVLHRNIYEDPEYDDECAVDPNTGNFLPAKKEEPKEEEIQYKRVYVMPCMSGTLEYRRMK